MKLLAFVVLVLGFFFVWGGLVPFETLPEDGCPQVSAPEYGYTFEAQWWPPGTVECVATSIQGDVLGRTTFVPWRDYAVVLLLALAVGVLSLRPTRLLASLALFLAAMAVFWL